MTFKILYVEDEDHNKALMREVFKFSGYELIEAHDGQSGYEAALHDHPDLILMDSGLPDMHGADVVLRIKHTPAIAHIPVIALTADDSRENKERCLEAGCINILFKPVSRFILIETIRRHIDTGGKPAPANTPQTGPLVARKQVLIADDNDDLRLIFTKVFNPQYFEVRSASDGIEAIEQLQQSKPDVLILDVNMPGLSGFDVLNYVRNEDRLRDIKVILVTGNVMAPNDPQAQKADLVLLKPVDISALFLFAKKMMAPNASTPVQS